MKGGEGGAAGWFGTGQVRLVGAGWFGKNKVGLLGKRGGQVGMMTSGSFKIRQVCFRTRKVGLVGRRDGRVGMIKVVFTVNGDQGHLRVGRAREKW